MTSTDISTRPTMGLEEQISYAQALAGADLLPEAYFKKPANVLIAMQAGEALGITPFQAIQGIDVIKGKMSLSAELMRALVLRDGHTLRVDVLTDNGCRMLAARHGRPDDVQTFDFTMEDAKRAGLAGGNWAKHPKAMLLARCTTMTCRAVFPDVIGGFAATEEQDDVTTPVRATSHLLPDTAPPVAEPVEGEQLLPMSIVDEDTGEIVDADVVEPA